MYISVQSNGMSKRIPTNNVDALEEDVSKDVHVHVATTLDATEDKPFISGSKAEIRRVHLDDCDKPPCNMVLR